MKIVLTARDIEDAIKDYMSTYHGMAIKSQDIKWTESEIIHPVYPVSIEVK